MLGALGIAATAGASGPGTASQPPTGPESAASGYIVLEEDGGLVAFGAARRLLASLDPGAVENDDAFATESHVLEGTLGGAEAVAMALKPDRSGIHILLDDGRLAGLGQIGVLPGVDPAILTERREEVSTLAALPDGNVWVFTTAGRIVPQRGALPPLVDAHMRLMLFLRLDGPIIDVIPTPSGRGALAAAADGGVFAYGDAVYIDSVRGQLQAIHGAPLEPERPIVGIVSDPDGRGYWMVGDDGGVFGIAAPFVGSLPQVVRFDDLVAPVGGMVPYGNGYLLVADDGGVFTFSDLDFAGSAFGLVDSDVVDIISIY